MVDISLQPNSSHDSTVMEEDLVCHNSIERMLDNIDTFDMEIMRILIRWDSLS